MLFFYHINELKYRAFYFSISFLLTWILFFSNKFYFFHFFCSHFPTTFIFTYLSEALTSFLWFTAFIAFIYLLPVILYHFYQFFLTGLYTHEATLVRHNSLAILITSFLSFIFNWLYLLPLFTQLLLYNNVNSLLEFSPKISEYVSFIIYFSVIINIIILIPVIIFLLFPTHQHSSFTHILIRYRLHLYFLLGIIISFITPPDLFIVIGMLFLFLMFIETLFCFNCIKRSL